MPSSPSYQSGETALFIAVSGPLGPSEEVKVVQMLLDDHRMTSETVNAGVGLWLTTPVPFVTDDDHVARLHVVRA